MNTVSVEFTQEELNAIAELMDAAVKHLGLRGARNAAAIVLKLETAVAAKQQTEEKHDD